MFIVRFLKYSFQPALILTRLKEHIAKYVLYFLLMTFISAFPISYLIVQSQGFKLDFIESDFSVEEPMWDLPEDFAIIGNQFVYLGSGEAPTVTLEHRGILYVFNHKGDINKNKKQVLFTKETIIYVNGKGSIMKGNGYSGFIVDETRFKDLNEPRGSEERKLMFRAFGNQVEHTFSDYIVLYALLINVGQTILINLIMIILFSLIIQLFRFGYSKFMSYTEALKFLILSMGIPSVLSLIFGVIVPGFGPVVFQLSMGLFVMIVMLVFGKKYYS